MVGLTSAHERLIRDVSDLLGFYGIKTSIAKRQRQGKFPNGKDYDRMYESYELTINSTADVEQFTGLVRLSHARKRAVLFEALGRHRTDVEAESIEIESVELSDRREDVWDISVSDETHCFQLAHAITGNCSHPHFDALCEILQEEVPDQAKRGLWTNKLLGTRRDCARDVLAPWPLQPEHPRGRARGR